MKFLLKSMYSDKYMKYDTKTSELLFEKFIPFIGTTYYYRTKKGTYWTYSEYFFHSPEASIINEQDAKDAICNDYDKYTSIFCEPEEG